MIKEGALMTTRKTNKFSNWMYENQLKHMDEKNIPTALEDLAKYLEETLAPIRYGIILHDKDVSKDDPKKLAEPHIHIFFVLKNPVVRNAKSIAEKFGDNPQQFTAWEKHANNGWSYLVHQTKDAKESGKYQYDPLDVVFGGENKDGTSFNYSEKLDSIQQGVKRTRKVSLEALIDFYGEGHMTFDEVMDQLSPTEFASIESKLKSASNFLFHYRRKKFLEAMSKPGAKIKILYLYGTTWTGKTHWAKQKFKKDYFVSGSNRDIAQFYAGEPVFIYDDARPTDLTYNQMLKFLDDKNLEKVLGSRYSDKKIIAHTIVITTPYPPEEFYLRHIKQMDDSMVILLDEHGHPMDARVETSSDKPDQFYRRFDLIAKFTQDEISFLKYNYESDKIEKLENLTVENKWSRKVSKDVVEINPEELIQDLFG